MECCGPKLVCKKEDKCPGCNDNGATVDIITVKKFVNDYQENMFLKEDYKFCSNPSCNIVYFSKGNAHFFHKQQLKEKVTLKEKDLEVKICYCFGHTKQSVLNEIKSTGDTSVLNDIKTKMKELGCFCKTSNPQGICCLGNVTSWLNEIEVLKTKYK